MKPSLFDVRIYLEENAIDMNFLQLPSLKRYFYWCFLIACFPITVESAPVVPDWPHWRGPEYNGKSRETGLIDDWNPKGGKNVRWSRDDLGGRSTPIVLNGRLYMMAPAPAGERIICLDAASGETLWEQRFNVWLSDVPRERVGWSSPVGDPETGHVYALGVCGIFQCFHGETGEILWAVPLHERFGLLSTYGGRTNFPIICEDLVIISGVVIGWGNMARPAHRLIAFDKITGDVIWFNGTRPLPYDTTYSSPSLNVISGTKSLVFGSGDGSVWSFQPRTGKPIWNYRFSRRGLNISPLVVGNYVYSGHSEENISGNTMGAVAAIDATGKGDITETHELWQERELMVGKSSPVEIDGRLYCVDERARLMVFETKSGEPVGREISLRGTQMRSSLLAADGKLYAFAVNGRWSILRPVANSIEVVSRGRLPRGEECHASPICANGRIYIPSTGQLYCLEDSSQEHGVTERPTAPEELPVTTDTEIAHVQLVPAEVLMSPGQSQQFSVRLFNSRGQQLEHSAVEFSLSGQGELTPDGIFTAAGGDQHVDALIKARHGTLQGTARIRIVPPLPWNFDFDNTPLSPQTGTGEPTVTWVGARYRHVVRNVKGNQVMVKVTTIPKGTRSRCWFGPSDLHDYTIQADIQGDIRNGKMPDIGLIAQGYTLDLLGQHQKLQVRTWGTELRMAKTVDYSWQSGQWYTMKFQASTVADKKILQGKIWLRDSPEPKEWTVEATDDFPNRSGSPGLFGNAKDAQLFLDNIRVYENFISTN